jgi:hypothetical protein
VHEEGRRTVITVPALIIGRGSSVLSGDVHRPAAWRQDDKRWSRRGRPGCSQGRREGVVVVRLALVRVAVECSRNRGVVVVRVGMVRVLVKNDRQDGNTGAGPQQRADESARDETSSHTCRVSHTT